MTIAGRLIDKYGTKLGYGVSVIIMEYCGNGSCSRKRCLGFWILERIPRRQRIRELSSAIKSIAEWFPKKESALATGIFNSGTNVGAIVAPLAIPAIIAGMGLAIRIYNYRGIRLHLDNLVVYFL